MYSLPLFQDVQLFREATDVQFDETGSINTDDEDEIEM